MTSLPAMPPLAPVSPAPKMCACLLPIALLAFAPGSAGAAPPALIPPQATNDARPVIPVLDLQRPGRGYAAQAGRTADFKGFVLPLEQEGDQVYSFLLVPWAGACSHMPAPPPDQIILVVPQTPFTLAQIYEPVTVTGLLRARHEISQLFVLDGVMRVESGFVISAATISIGSAAIRQAPPAARSPWKFLTPAPR